MKIDTYYDITCCRCARSRSTDFEKGMYQSKKVLTVCAKKEGWGEDSTSHMPICPNCGAKMIRDGGENESVSAAHARIVELESELEAKERAYSTLQESYMNTVAKIILELCNNGLFNVYANDGKIYMRSTKTGECVCIGGE